MEEEEEDHDQDPSDFQKVKSKMSGSDAVSERKYCCSGLFSEQCFFSDFKLSGKIRLDFGK